MEVGDLLQFQRPLHAGSIVQVPAQEEDVIVSVVLLRQGRQVGVEVDGPLHQAGELLNGLHQCPVPLVIQPAQAAGQIHRQQIQHRHLGGVSLGGGHGNFRPGPGVEHIVRQFGNGAAHHVDDGQHPGPPGLALLHGGDGVRRLAGLGDHHQQGVLIHQGVAVAQLRGQVCLHRNPAQVLDDILAHAAGIVGRAAGSDHDLVDVFQFLIGEGEVVQHHLPVLDPGFNGGFDGVGLLHDLLKHEVVIPTLFRCGDVPGDAGDGFLLGFPQAVVDGDTFGGDVCNLPILQIDDVFGVGHQGSDIGGKVVFPNAHPDDERGGVAGCDDAPLFLGTEDPQGIGAL